MSDNIQDTLKQLNSDNVTNTVDMIGETWKKFKSEHADITDPAKLWQGYHNNGELKKMNDAVKQSLPQLKVDGSPDPSNKLQIAGIWNGHEGNRHFLVLADTHNREDANHNVVLVNEKGQFIRATVHKGFGKDTEKFDFDESQAKNTIAELSTLAAPPKQAPEQPPVIVSTPRVVPSPVIVQSPRPEQPTVNNNRSQNDISKELYLGLYNLDAKCTQIKCDDPVRRQKILNDRNLLTQNGVMGISVDSSTGQLYMTIRSESVNRFGTSPEHIPLKLKLDRTLAPGLHGEYRVTVPGSNPANYPNGIDAIEIYDFDHAVPNQTHKHATERILFVDHSDKDGSHPLTEIDYDIDLTARPVKSTD